LRIKKFIKKIKPAISVISIISAVVIASMSRESASILWTSIAKFLMALGVCSYFAWTLGSESERSTPSD